MVNEDFPIYVQAIKGIIIIFHFDGVWALIERTTVKSIKTSPCPIHCFPDFSTILFAFIAICTTGRIVVCSIFTLLNFANIWAARPLLRLDE